MPLTWRTWLVGFAFTLVFELPIVLASLRYAAPRLHRRLQMGLCANLLTHPLVWFCFSTLPVGLSSRLTISELWAFGVEAWFYASFCVGVGVARAVLTSLVANATSFGLGWLLVIYFGRWLF